MLSQWVGVCRDGQSPGGHSWEGKLAQRQPVLFQVHSSEALGFLGK